MKINRKKKRKKKSIWNMSTTPWCESLKSWLFLWFISIQGFIFESHAYSSFVVLMQKRMICTADKSSLSQAELISEHVCAQKREKYSESMHLVSQAWSNTKHEHCCQRSSAPAADLAYLDTHWKGHQCTKTSSHDEVFICFRLCSPLICAYLPWPSVTKHWSYISSIKTAGASIEIRC